MPFVVDASVALSWSFPDERSDYATQVLRNLARDNAITSPIWPLEVANAVLLAERRGRIDEATRAEAVARLTDIAPELAAFGTDESLGAIADLARIHDLTAYDASYLYVDMREDLPLATVDRRLRTAATAAGVSLVD